MSTLLATAVLPMHTSTSIKSLRLVSGSEGAPPYPEKHVETVLQTLPMNGFAATSASAGRSIMAADMQAAFDNGCDYIPLATDDPPSFSERENVPRPRTTERHGSKREDGRTLDVGGKRKLADDVYGDHENKKWVNPSLRKAPWLASANWDSCNNVAELMHKEVEAFIKYISPTPAEDEVRGLMVDLITNAVTEAFPDATVYAFGSYETKLYLPSGDIDLVVFSDSMAYSKKVAVLHALAHTLKHAQITSKVSIIASAKVPIVKFVTTHGRFNVDISINQGNGVTAGKIIKGFLNDMHGTGQGLALRGLIMITKLFLSQRGMNEVFSGGLGSYSIVCLAVSFLQMHPKIRKGEIDAEKNLGVLVMEFFELYGLNFNYDEAGISVRNGGRYYNKRQKGWSDDRRSYLLSIEDPADPSNDISKGSYAMTKVRATFAGAHGILTSAAYRCAGILGARRKKRAVHLRHEYVPEDLSILSTIVGVTQETINHRRLIQEVYDKRTLHSLLGITTTIPSRPLPIVDRVANEQALQSTWQEADGNLSPGNELEARPKIRRWNDEDKEEEGRYDIGRGRQNKRRKTDRYRSPIVFISDEEDADEDHVCTDSVDVSIRDQGADGEVTKSTRVDVRRSYWSAKS